jgi:hypothetical protein
MKNEWQPPKLDSSSEESEEEFEEDVELSRWALSDCEKVMAVTRSQEILLSIRMQSSTEFLFSLFSFDYMCVCCAHEKEQTWKSVPYMNISHKCRSVSFSCTSSLTHKV